MTVHGRSGLFIVIFVLLLSLSSFPSLAESNMDYVRGLYKELLNREPDPSGIQTWVGVLDSGKMSRDDVAKNIRNSEEYLKRHGHSKKDEGKEKKKSNNLFDRFGEKLEKLQEKLKGKLKGNKSDPPGTSGNVAGNAGSTGYTGNPGGAVNESAGYKVRLKDYSNQPNRTYKGRRTVVKLDSRFRTDQGLTDKNARVEVDGKAFTYYGLDGESGDLCFYDGERFPEDYPKPFNLQIFKDGSLHTVIKVNEWRYGSVSVPTSDRPSNRPVSGGEGANSSSKTYDTDPMATGELNFETAGIKHQTTQCANGDWEYIFLSVYGENMGRFLLLHAGGGSRAIRYVLECPETKTMRMEIASDNLPDWHKWTVRWGNGELKVFLDGKQIGRTEAFNGKPNKFIVGGNKNSRRNFLGKWRSFNVKE